MSMLVVDDSPGAIVIRSMPVLKAFAYAVCGSIATPHGWIGSGKPLASHTWYDVIDSSPVMRTRMPSMRVNTAVTVPPASCSRSVHASSIGCALRALGSR